jgi:hypothetical protein
MGPGVNNATLKELLAPAAADPLSFFGVEHAPRMPIVVWIMAKTATERQIRNIKMVLYDKELQNYHKHMYYKMVACG